MTAHYHRFLLLKHKEYKTHKKTTKKKTKRREGVYLQIPFLSFHFWPPLVPFYFKHFLLVSFSSQAKEKEKNKEKKNHREEEKC